MIKVLGAAYLVYLGVRAILERPQHAGMSGAVRITPPQALRQATLAEVLNPKSALFFLAFLPQFNLYGDSILIFASYLLFDLFSRSVLWEPPHQITSEK